MAWRSVQKCANSTRAERVVFPFPHEGSSSKTQSMKPNRPVSWPVSVAASKIDGVHDGPNQMFQTISKPRPTLGEVVLFTTSDPSCLMQGSVLPREEAVPKVEECSSDEETWLQEQEKMSRHDVWKIADPCNVCHYGNEDSEDSESPPEFNSPDEALEHWRFKVRMMKSHIAFLKKTLMEARDKKCH